MEKDYLDELIERYMEILKDLYLFYMTNGENPDVDMLYIKLGVITGDCLFKLNDKYADHLEGQRK